MGNTFSSPKPSLPSQQGMVGTYKRVSCTGLDSLLLVQTGLADKRAQKAGSVDTPCCLTVTMDESNSMWSMKYKRSNLVQIIMFRMPIYAKCPVDVVKVINVPEKTTPQPRMEVVRNKGGNIIAFSDKKGTIRIERKFSEDWAEMIQVTTVRGEDVACTEVFRRVMEEKKDNEEQVLEGEEIV